MQNLRSHRIAPFFELIELVVWACGFFVSSLVDIAWKLEDHCFGFVDLANMIWKVACPSREVCVRVWARASKYVFRSEIIKTVTCWMAKEIILQRAQEKLCSGAWASLDFSQVDNMQQAASKLSCCI